MLHISPEITIYILTITFILGCCLGSFADCAAGRLLSGESVVAGRSHCDHCGHVLGVLWMIFVRLLRDMNISPMPAFAGRSKHE